MTSTPILRDMVSRNSHTVINEGYSETRKLDVLEVRTLTFDLAAVCTAGWLTLPAEKRTSRYVPISANCKDLGRLAQRMLMFEHRNSGDRGCSYPIVNYAMRIYFGKRPSHLSVRKGPSNWKARLDSLGCRALELVFAEVPMRIWNSLIKEDTCRNSKWRQTYQATLPQRPLFLLFPDVDFHRLLYTVFIFSRRTCASILPYMNIPA